MQLGLQRMAEYSYFWFFVFLLAIAIMFLTVMALLAGVAVFVIYRHVKSDAKPRRKERAAFPER